MGTTTFRPAGGQSREKYCDRLTRVESQPQQPQGRKDRTKGKKKSDDDDNDKWTGITVPIPA